MTLARAASQVRAVAIYEFRMQARRPAIWLLLGSIGAYMLWLLHEATVQNLDVQSPVGQWAVLMQILCPVAFGVLLADRFARDRRTKVADLLDTTPASDAARLVGKYLGATAATTLPILILYALGIAWRATQFDTTTVIGQGVAAFLLINLPGLLFVAAFSICVPILIRVPLYQFLFVGYWFWGNLMPPQTMPTLSMTWLAPIGYVPAQAFFHPFVDRGTTPDWGALDAVISISLLFGLAVAALVVCLLVSRQQRSRA